MPYTDKVLDHFNNPRNVGALDKNDPAVGTGIVGAPECGDVMKLQIKVDQNEVITDAKFKTFGCGAAIAASSLATEWIKGRTVEQANELKNTALVEELSLPPVKIHCSVLAEDAIKAAIADWRRKQAAESEAARQDLQPAAADPPAAVPTGSRVEPAAAAPSGAQPTQAGIPGDAR